MLFPFRLLAIAILISNVLADQAHIRAHKNYTETRKRCERETCRDEDLDSLNGMNCVFKCISYQCWKEVQDSMILENGDNSFRKVRRNRIFANCARRLKRESDKISRETKSKTDLYTQINETIFHTDKVPLCPNLKGAKLPLEQLTDKYIDELTELQEKQGMITVSQPRKLTTLYLARAALLHPMGGDFVETGVFTGGSTALMMRVLMEFDGCDRKLWAFDSFEGLPELKHEDSKGIQISGQKGDFKITQKNFERNLKSVQAWDDDRIVVTKGWFNETCAGSPVKDISFLRLDGDLFVSTWDPLAAFYDRVIPGGYVYVDDYGSFNGCREAIDKFRFENKIFEPLRFVREDDLVTRRISFEAVWWQKRA